jgi:hypothetical protein
VVNRTKRKRAVDNDGTEPPQKVQYKCSICGNYGHNKRSCRFRKPTSVDAVDNSTNVPAFENNMQTTDASGTNNRTAVLDNGFVVAPVDMQLDDAESAVPCSHTTEILDQLPDKGACTFFFSKPEKKTKKKLFISYVLFHLLQMPM